jgi:hypothetical protein
LPNLALAVAQLPGFVSGELPGTDAAPDAAPVTAIVVSLPEGICCHTKEQDYRTQNNNFFHL